MSNSNDMSVMVPSESSRRQALLEVRDGLSICVQKLKSTSEAMTHIESQGRISAFLNKSNNIREIATHVGDLTDVQQQTLKMLVLLMGGIIRVKQDYNEVMDTIELLSNENSGHLVVLDYLLKLKKTVAELKRRDEAVEALSQVAGETEQRVELLDANLREAGQIASQAMTSLQTHIGQVAQNMMQLTADQGRLNENIDLLASEKKTLEDSVAQQVVAVAALSHVAGETQQRVALLDSNLREAGQIASEALNSLRAHIEHTAQSMMQLTSDQGRLNENVDRLTAEKKTLEDSVEQQVKAYSTEALIRMAQLEDADKIYARKVRFLHRQGKRLRRGLIWLAAAIAILAIVEGVSIFAMLWRR